MRRSVHHGLVACVLLVSLLLAQPLLTPAFSDPRFTSSDRPEPARSPLTGSSSVLFRSADIPRHMLNPIATPGVHETSALLGRRSVGLLLAAGGAAYMCKSLANSEQMAQVLDGSVLDGVMDVANTYADGLTVGIGTLGLALMGRVAGNERLELASRDLISSLFLSGGTVWALKIAIDARRPNGGRFSFPSGHTAAAFAIAPVVTRHWGWQAGAPAYGLALATALARMEDRRHHLADVLAGATIGFVIGYEVSRVGSDEGGGGGLGGFLRHVSPFPEGLGLSIDF